MQTPKSEQVIRRKASRRPATKPPMNRYDRTQPPLRRCVARSLRRFVYASLPPNSSFVTRHSAFPTFVSLRRRCSITNPSPGIRRRTARNAYAHNKPTCQCHCNAWRYQEHGGTDRTTPRPLFKRCCQKASRPLIRSRETPHSTSATWAIRCGRLASGTYRRGRLVRGNSGPQRGCPERGHSVAGKGDILDDWGNH